LDGEKGPVRALVTGGGGFLGRYIVEKLLQRGDQVRILARGHYPDLERAGVEGVQADIRDASRVAEACAGIDVVFHVAALPAIWGKWEDFYGINFEGTKNVVAGSVAHGVGRLVYTSTPSVVFDGSNLCGINETYPYPQRYSCHYPATKAMAERYVIATNGKQGLLTTALRPHLVWGPGDRHLIPRVLNRARAGRLFIVGDGSNKVDITYVENAAEAHLQAMDHLQPGSPVAGQVYFISQGEPVALWDFINQILERLGIPRVTRRIPCGIARVFGGGLEVLYNMLRLSTEPPMTRFLATHLARSHFFDISKAIQHFGYRPRITTIEGLERLVSPLRRL
jgi:nucleoside-diphosphate-sugar epimerase